MGMKGYIPRLSVEIREDQLAALQELLEHGERKKLFGLIVDDVIRLLRLDKVGFLMCVYAKALKLEDYSIRIGDITHGNGRGPSQVDTKDGQGGEIKTYPRSATGEENASEEIFEEQYEVGYEKDPEG